MVVRVYQVEQWFTGTKRGLAKMNPTFFADTNPKIRKLNKDGKYSVKNKIRLTLVKRGESKYFEDNIRFPFNKTGQKFSYPVGVFEKEINLDQAIDRWNEMNLWIKKIKSQNYLGKKKSKFQKKHLDKLQKNI